MMQKETKEQKGWRDGVIRHTKHRHTTEESKNKKQRRRMCEDKGERKEEEQKLSERTE